MSKMEILCEGCGFPQVYCKCAEQQPNTPPAPLPGEVEEAVAALREDYETYCPQPDHDPPKDYYARVRWWAVHTILSVVSHLKDTADRLQEHIDNGGVCVGPECLMHQSLSAAQDQVEKLREDNVELHEEVSRRVKAASRAERHEDMAIARAEAAEAWKAHVLAWAKNYPAGACHFCGHRGTSRAHWCEYCLPCVHETSVCMGFMDNWTPPTAWEGK